MCQSAASLCSLPLGFHDSITDLLVSKENREAPSKHFLFKAFPACWYCHSFHHCLLWLQFLSICSLLDHFWHGGRLWPGEWWCFQAVISWNSETLTALGIFGAWLFTDPMLFCWENRQARFAQVFLNTPWAALNLCSLGSADWGAASTKLQGQ